MLKLLIIKLKQKEKTMSNEIDEKEMKLIILKRIQKIQKILRDDTDNNYLRRLKELAQLDHLTDEEAKEILLAEIEIKGERNE